jgi:arabinofuranosyltransferase
MVGETNLGPDSGLPGGRWRLAALAAVAALLAWLFFRNGWVADDAYITFRSVEQLFAGNGPRWNPHERVQVFTHPLWFGLLALTRLASRHLYWNSLVLSFLVTTAAVFGIRCVPGIDRARWFVAVALLASSKAFVDYAWSGLETPVTYLLLGWLVVVWLRGRNGVDHPEAAGRVREVTTLALIAGLLALNHPDLLLFALPPLAHSIWTGRRTAPRAALGRALAMGLAPAAAWATFATVYYGTPIPNTAYAKLNTGIPEHELWIQGLRYVTQTAIWDPVTVLTCAVVLPAMLRAERWRWIGHGLVLHLVYVVKIGGDFMVGRLFAPAFFVSAICGATLIRRRGHQMTVFALLALVNLVVPYSPIRLPEHFEVQTAIGAPETHGIVDEKAVYFEEQALRRRLSLPATPLPVARDQVSVATMIGLYGYTAGLDQIIIDGHALSDPLLARLPATRPWRPGHFWRERPEGYEQSLRDGVNRVKNPRIRRLYEDVRVMTQGRLFSGERLAAMLRLHFATKRPECIDPPCRELIVQGDFLPRDYRPRLFSGGGRVLSTAVTGAGMEVAGVSSLPPDSSGQKIFVIITESVIANRISHLPLQTADGTETPSENEFLVGLAFTSPCHAERAARTLCLATKSDDTRTLLLESGNEICSRLVLTEGSAPVTEREAQPRTRLVPPACEETERQRSAPRRRKR